MLNARTIKGDFKPFPQILAPFFLKGHKFKAARINKVTITRNLIFKRKKKKLKDQLYAQIDFC